MHKACRVAAQMFLNICVLPDFGSVAVKIFHNSVELDWWTVIIFFFFFFSSDV